MLSWNISVFCFGPHHQRLLCTIRKMFAGWTGFYSPSLNLNRILGSHGKHTWRVYQKFILVRKSTKEQVRITDFRATILYVELFPVPNRVEIALRTKKDSCCLSPN